MVHEPGLLQGLTIPRAFCIYALCMWRLAKCGEQEAREEIVESFAGASIIFFTRTAPADHYYDLLRFDNNNNRLISFQ